MASDMEGLRHSSFFMLPSLLLKMASDMEGLRQYDRSFPFLSPVENGFRYGRVTTVHNIALHLADKLKMASDMEGLRLVFTNIGSLVKFSC